MNLAQKYTYKDYRTWPEDERWELIHGEAFALAAPSTAHQDWVLEIAAQLKAQLRGKPCKPYIAPVDLMPYLATSDDFDKADTVIQPDVLVICDNGQNRGQAIVGAPAFVVEVLSPSTGYRDQTEKLKVYEETKVAEYLVLNPVTLHVWLYRLEGQRFGKPEVWVDPAVVELASLPGVQIDFTVEP
jgi:Uma2 family endonuclease